MILLNLGSFAFGTLKSVMTRNAKETHAIWGFLKFISNRQK